MERSDNNACEAQSPFVVFLGDKQDYQLARLRALEGTGLSRITFLAAHDKLEPLLHSVPQCIYDRCAEIVNTGAPATGSHSVEAAIVTLLEFLRPSCVLVVGYARPAMRRISYWTKRNKIPCIMTTDSTAVDRNRGWLSEKVKGWWCRYFYDALLLPGERSVAYFTGLGYPEHKIWRGSSVVDNRYFCASGRQARSEAEEMRKKLGLPERYFLTVCRLSPEKGLTDLVEAFRIYRQRGGDWDLVIVGDGPQRLALESEVSDKAIDGAHFIGWTPNEELPPYYALASVFVLASRSEPWGLVVNEALASGLPVLVSRKCGCVPELCRRAVNGYDFDPEKPDELAGLMLGTAHGRIDLPAFGEASLRIIDVFTPETWAATVCDCVDSLTATRNALRRYSNSVW